MTKRDRRVVGFDRTLELTWLDACAGFVADGLTGTELRQRLFVYLDGVVPGETNSSARGKTVTVLTRIWSRVDQDSAELRDSALQTFANASPGGRFVLHWMMAMAAYPYFFDVAATVGRLLQLHEEMGVPQLTRRLGDVWGQRELVQRTAQVVARSMALWGALELGDTRGRYRRPAAPILVEPALGPLLAECVLRGARLSGMPAADLSTHPALFPFQVVLDIQRLRSTDRLEVNRIGLNTDLVSLRLAS